MTNKVIIATTADTTPMTGPAISALLKPLPEEKPEEVVPCEPEDDDPAEVELDCEVVVGQLGLFVEPGWAAEPPLPATCEVRNTWK